MEKKYITVGVVVILVVSAISFWGGMKYDKLKNPGFSQRQQRGTGGAFTAGRQGGRQSGQFINGDIISKDDKSLTVRTQDGGSKIIFYTASTSVGKTIEGSISDLEVGTRVMVGGSANSDGTVAAQTIQIRSATTTPGNNR